jgi:hypothetical protein
VKQPGRDVTHPPLYSAEVKNDWSYTSTPPICLYAVDKSNLTFIFYSVLYICFEVFTAVEIHVPLRNAGIQLPG